ncbi:MAG: hypothetical protein GX489_07955 [Firmicutes bacterium]|jgi:hypothetical protein|nr:hypothetical protein [Bacillota bacterium]NLG87136.1 hypothetical protein [Bacillota bacterium]
MRMRETELDITKNLRAIDWLKTELLGAVTLVFRAALRGSEEVLSEALAQVILIVYLLGRRLGISFATLDSKLLSMVGHGVADEHELEKWYGDLSALDAYLRTNKR